MEIVKIGKMLANCCYSPNPPMFFYYQCFLLYGNYLATCWKFLTVQYMKIFFHYLANKNQKVGLMCT